MDDCLLPGLPAHRAQLEVQPEVSLQSVLYQERRWVDLPVVIQLPQMASTQAADVALAAEAEITGVIRSLLLATNILARILGQPHLGQGNLTNSI